MTLCYVYAVVYVCAATHVCVLRWVLSDCLSGRGASVYIQWALGEPGGEAGSNISLAILVHKSHV